MSTIEARMASSRLPGKTLAPIIGRPMLELLIERLKRSKHIEQIVVATTTNREDLAIRQLAEHLNVGCYRGSSENVLDRVWRAAQTYEADLIVEITGDCPLIDPDVVDKVIDIFLSGDYDYVSNILERTYPLGLDTQVFPVKVLAEVAELTEDPFDREHVSLYIYEHPERYRLGNLVAEGEIRRPDLRLTVDTHEDLALISEIYKRLYPQTPDFSIYDVVRLLNQYSELTEINAQIIQKPSRYDKA
jgi:spore coat polysaccharide biosynthesis protein SpsF